MLNTPTTLAIGDTLTWRSDNLRGIDPSTGKEVALLPTTTTLTWKFAREGAAFSITSTADGSEFVTTIPSEVSEELTAGDYYYQVFIEINSVSRLYFSGTLKVVAVVADGADNRTTAQKLLDAVNAAIQTILDGGAVQSYSIKGRNLSRMSLAELMSLRDSLKMEVYREKTAESIAQGLGDPRRLYVRFK
jgi:hypothetical protein